MTPQCDVLQCEGLTIRMILTLKWQFLANVTIFTTCSSDVNVRQIHVPRNMEKEDVGKNVPSHNFSGHLLYFRCLLHYMKEGEENKIGEPTRSDLCN